MAKKDASKKRAPQANDSAKTPTKAAKRPAKAAKRRRNSPAPEKADSVSKPAKRRSAGRPPFKPTAEQRKNVETLAGLGLKRDEICLLVENPTTRAPIDEKTLRRHFRRELDRGAPKMGAKIAESIARKALGDGPQSVTAAIWFSKCRMGWRERVAVDVDVRSGVLVSPPNRSPEEWIAEAASRAATSREPGVEDDD